MRRPRLLTLALAATLGAGCLRDFEKVYPDAAPADGPRDAGAPPDGRPPDAAPADAAPVAPVG